MGWPLNLSCWAQLMTTGRAVTYVAETGKTTHLLRLGGLPEINSTLMWYVIILDVGIFLTGLGKIAIGITILRILGRTSLWQRCVVWTVLFLTVSTCFIDFGVSTFRCGDPTITWTLEAQATAKCVSTQTQSDINLFSNVVQVVADFAFSIVPMIVVSGLRMPKRRKTNLLVALGLTLLTGVAGIVKTYHAATFDIMDLSWTIFPGLVWFGLEAMLIIVCGTAPTLNPLYDKYITPRRRGYRCQGTSKYETRTYVNSRTWGLSKVLTPDVKKGFASHTFKEYSVRRLRNHGRSQMQQEPASFEMPLPKVDYYSLQAPATAHVTPRDPNTQNQGRIQALNEIDVILGVDPRHGFINV